MAVALVVAAGRGERLGTPVPKAFANLAGRPMLEWSLAALHGLLVDDPAQAGDARVLTRDHDGHVVVKDLDGEVLAGLTEDLLVLLLDDLAGAMMRVHDVVADLELDVLHLDDCLEVLLRVYFLDRFGNDVPPWFLCRGAQGCAAS